MADFKLCISDPESGKTYQKEIKDKEGDFFIGKNLGETIKGESMGINGYEFLITGGSDNCGFPMRKGIMGARKKLVLMGGVGLRERFSRGIKKKKTVCGHKISQNIVQINLKVTKEGPKKLDAIFGKEEAAEKKEEKKEAKEGRTKEAAKAEEKESADKEAEPEKEAPKEKHEAKPDKKEAKEEKKEEPAKEEKK